MCLVYYFPSHLQANKGKVRNRNIWLPDTLRKKNPCQTLFTIKLKTVLFIVGNCSQIACNNNTRLSRSLWTGSMDIWPQHLELCLCVIGVQPQHWLVQEKDLPWSQGSKTFLEACMREASITISLRWSIMDWEEGAEHPIVPSGITKVDAPRKILKETLQK